GGNYSFSYRALKLIYMATVAGNMLITALVVVDKHLHTSMYYFLGNLSCLETCYTSTLLPRMLVSLLTGDKTISFSGCLSQLYHMISYDTLKHIALSKYIYHPCIRHYQILLYGCY
uniref:G-protein coupled receptors family 1 profile domain-containing protein n=1 Tax=Gopherus evgoodei TaxID=1825980 RepID=A0A8C4Y5X9_9SAUR